MNLQEIKNRFEIIGNSPALNRALEVALQVAPTNLSVLITGESGTGKEAFSKIIHNLSTRKHGPFIAVNCGAIPEGTIDSELFGHEKGSFTGATDSRKGYFEVVNGGTIFLDEVAELPLQTQVRLLRVLETGEFIRVGSSKTQKTDVRVVAATNVNMQRAVERGKFREDLYYRLNTVPITVPPLRERKDDIPLLFMKFAYDFAEKYRVPVIELTPSAIEVCMAYRWPGNIRQLKNVAEQVSVLEKDRQISGEVIKKYLPANSEITMPQLFDNQGNFADINDTEMLYKILVEMRKDINDLKKLVLGVITNDSSQSYNTQNIYTQVIDKLNTNGDTLITRPATALPLPKQIDEDDFEHFSEEVEESLSLQEKEADLIEKALQKHRGKRKNAAKELGISERTLYRKIKEYNIKS